MSAVHEEFTAVLLARKVIAPEQLIDAWQLADRRTIPVEDALVMLGCVTTDEVKEARAILTRSRHLDYADLLVWKELLGTEQAEEARTLARQSGTKLADALVKLGHASEEQVSRAVAEFNGLPFIDVSEMTFPPAVLGLMPESVVRELIVLPLALDGSTLEVILSDPSDTATLEKLQSLLAKEINPVVAVKGQIAEAITRHYGEAETASEATFAEASNATLVTPLPDATDVAPPAPEPPPDKGSITPKPAPHESNAADTPAGTRRPTERRATVRYANRMNPRRTFPLRVILSPHEGVSQALGGEEGLLVEIEPVLPGCTCYPPRDRLRVRDGEASVTFWVVPQVLGRVEAARVVVRQDGEVLTEVSLDVCVVEQRLTWLMAALSLVLPFMLFVLKHLNLAPEGQGLGLYGQVARWLVAHLTYLTPEVLTGVLVAATGGLYFWLRPRRCEVLSAVEVREPPVPVPVEAKPEAAVPTPAPAPAAVEPKREEAPAPVPAAPKTVPVEELLSRAKKAFARGEDREGERYLAELVAKRPLDTQGLLMLAERREKAGKFSTALALYERALTTGRCGARAYFRAALVAHFSGDTSRALDVLLEAETDLPPEEMRGPLLYTMAFFAARLGRYPDALQYLHRAVDAGFDDLDKFRADPDVEPLRWHAGFRRLLADVGR